MLLLSGWLLVIAVVDGVRADATATRVVVDVGVVVVHCVEMAEFVTHHHFGLVRHHRSVRESFQVGVDGQEIARSSCRTVAGADAANASAASGRIEIIGDGRSCRLVVRLSRLALVDATERVGRHNE